MDISELLKKIESGETTASDAEWLSNWEAEIRVYIGKKTIKHVKVVFAARKLLALIEEEPYRLTSRTFCSAEECKEAINNLKEALEKS